VAWGNRDASGIAGTSVWECSAVGLNVRSGKAVAGE
jgi:hypothetical protein